MKLEIKKSDPRKPVPIRLNTEERAKLQKLADEWTDGDFSKYMRFAALNFDPATYSKKKPKKT